MSAPRLIRILLSLAVIVGAVIVLYPRIFSDIRSNGTINARMVTVQAPISGTIVRDLPDVGSLIDDGVLLTRITDDSESQGLLSSLTVERDFLTVRIAAIEQRLAEAVSMSATLDERVARYGGSLLENLAFRVREAGARREYWQAVLAERTSAVKRNKELVSKGAISAVRLEEAQSQLLQAREEINRAQADSDRFSQELNSARSGVFISDGQNDVPYSQQRLDELAIRKADLELELAEARGRLAAIGGQLEIEGPRAERRQSAVVRSPLKGIVWRRMVSANVRVTRNDDLMKILDCSTMFAEIAISESTAEKLDIGEPVIVRVQGSDTEYRAEVKEIRGTRSVTPGLEYAAAPPPLKKDEVLLVASFTTEDVYREPESFCGVGRRAEVTIDGEGPVSGGQN